MKQEKTFVIRDYRVEEPEPLTYPSGREKRRERRKKNRNKFGGK